MSVNFTHKSMEVLVVSGCFRFSFQNQNECVGETRGKHFPILPKFDWLCKDRLDDNLLLFHANQLVHCCWLLRLWSPPRCRRWPCCATFQPEHQIWCHAGSTYRQMWDDWSAHDSSKFLPQIHILVPAVHCDRHILPLDLSPQFSPSGQVFTQVHRSERQSNHVDLLPERAPFLHVCGKWGVLLGAVHTPLLRRPLGWRHWSVPACRLFILPNCCGQDDDIARSRVRSFRQHRPCRC